MAGQQGGNHDRITYNLEDAFILVDGHEVHPMLSANLAIAMNKMGRLPMIPEPPMATAAIKAATVQVIQIRENQVPSHSTSSN